MLRGWQGLLLAAVAGIGWSDDGVLVTGTASFADGLPASGQVQLVLAGPGIHELQLEAALDERGRFAMRVPAAPAFVARAAVALGPGLPPLAAAAAWAGAREGPHQLQLTLPRGWFVSGLMRGPQASRALLAGAYVDAGAVAEAVADGQSRPRDEQLSFGPYAPFAVAPDGRFGPFWVAEAEAYAVIAAGADHWIHWRSPSPALPLGAVWDLGELKLAPATALEVTLDADPRLVLGYRLRLERLADRREGLPYAALFALQPELADSVFGQGRLALLPDRPLRLSPLPPDPELDLVLEAPTGKAAPPVRVALREGELAQVRLSVESLRPGELVSGRLLWSDSEAAIAGAEVRELGSGAVATTEQDGRFRIGPLPVEDELFFEAVQLAPDQPERRVYQRRAAGAAADLEWLWRVPPCRWLQARGLPASVDDATPVAFVLERRREHEGWAPVSPLALRRVPGGVDVGVGGEPGDVYRVGAAVSQLQAEYTEAVALAGADVEVRFTNRSPGQRLAGQVVGAAGVPLAAVQIQAVAQHGGLPPLTAFTDAAGRFDLGPANVERVTLLAQGPGGRAVQEVQPGLSFVLIRLR